MRGARKNGEEKPTAVGKELVRRLGRFVGELKKTEELEARFTCRTIKLDLHPKDYGAAEVKKVRQILGVSQALFAEFMGVSRAAVRSWERDVRPPNGAVCRLMDEIVHNPAYFRDRLQSLSSRVSNT